MSSSKEKDLSLPPPYEESHSSKLPDLGARLAQVQNARIRNLITQHISNLIDKQLSSGLNKAAFAFIPSDISLLSQKTSGEGDGDSLLKFPEGEYHSVVRLEGDNSTDFWRQPSVIEKLQHNLREQLGIETDSDIKKPASPPITLPPNPTATTSSSWRLFRKQSRQTQPGPERPAMFSQAGAGWRAEEDTSGSGKSLSVRYEEVTIRVQSDLGLYQTRMCPAVVVRLKLA